MSKIIIDIALIPDEKMIQYILDINENLDWRLNLAEDHHLPHISLFKWCIEESDLDNIIDYLDNVTLNLKGQHLVVEKAKSSNYEDGKTAGFYIQSDDNVLSLRNDIADNIRKYCTYKNMKNEYFIDDNIDPLSIEFVENYDNYKFKSHISLWFGQLPDIKLPIEFVADKLWIYHMWDFCTCAKPIKEYKLS